MLIFLQLLLLGQCGNVGTNLGVVASELFAGFSPLPSAHREWLEGVINTATFQDSPCMRMLGSNADGYRNGRYPRLIASEFMTDMVMAGPPKRNLVCRCVSDENMICDIIVKTGSLEDAVVKDRLDRNDRQRLIPFYIFETPEASSQELSPILFDDRNCDPPVLCEIRVIEKSTDDLYTSETNNVGALTRSQSDSAIDTSTEGSNSITRSASSPERFRYSTRPLPLRMCVRDTCPITMNEIRIHDIVYILKIDAGAIKSGKSVPCISAFGLKKIAQASSDGTFKDPLRRAVDENEILSLSDYDPYVIVEASGSCDENGGSSSTEFVSALSPSASTSASSSSHAHNAHISDFLTPETASTGTSGNDTSTNDSDSHSESEDPSRVRNLIKFYDNVATQPAEERISTKATASLHLLFKTFFIFLFFYIFVFFTSKLRKESKEEYEVLL